MNSTTTHKIILPTKIDTLQRQIQSLTHQIDSLNKVTAKNTVSSEYFHDILTSQVTTFVGIITIVIALIGFISWQGFTKTFRQSANRIKNDLNEKIKLHDVYITTLTNDFKSELNDIKDKHQQIENQSHRTICASLYEMKEYERYLVWGYAVIISHLTLNEPEKAEKFLDFLYEMLEGCELEKEKLKGDISALKIKTNEIIAFDNIEINKKIEYFEDQLYKIIYSENSEKGEVLSYPPPE